jgi:hypothetical protein
MVTTDSDCIALAARRHRLRPAGKRSIGELVDALTPIYDVLTPEQMTGQVEYL